MVALLHAVRIPYVRRKLFRCRKRCSDTALVAARLVRFVLLLLPPEIVSTSNAGYYLELNSLYLGNILARIGCSQCTVDDVADLIAIDVVAARFLQQVLSIDVVGIVTQVR